MLKTGTTIPQVAEGVQEGVETVRKWVKERSVPRKDAMVRLFDFTGGEVTPNDFFDLDKPRRHPEASEGSAHAAA